MNTDNTFIWECEARDYEIDFQGRVNNVYYLVYMEHARYKHCKSLGIDFRETHERNFDFVLVRTEIDFKASLKGTDEFIVTSKLTLAGKIRIVSDQQIIRKSDGKIMAIAKHIIVCVDRITGRPVVFKELTTMLSLK